MVKFCPECGKENIDTNKFCKYCGSKLPIIEEEKTDVEPIVEDSSEVIKENAGNIKTQLNEENINNKINGKDLIEKWKYKLFYWNNKELNEYKFSKTKSISILIFAYLFIWYILNPTIHGIIPILIVGTIISLIFAVPSFVIGYIIHYLMNRK